MLDYQRKLGVLDLASEADDGNGVKVAVIDTGIPEVSGVPVSLAENFTFEGPADSGHATFIGSILFGSGDGLRGVCPKATSCFCKVFDGKAAKPETVAEAIEYATNIWDVDVINLSLGFSGDTECNKRLQTACEKALLKGIVVVASAGNTGGKAFWPASLQGVIGVGASNGFSKEPYSNVGQVNIVAPGTGLCGLDVDGSIKRSSGTSFSAAVISGLVALLIAKRRRRGLKAAADDIKMDLVSMCVDLGETGWDPETGYGFPFKNMVPRTFGQLVVLSVSNLFAIIRGAITKAFAFLKTKEEKKHE
jgi:subtilisin family serine protease